MRGEREVRTPHPTPFAPPVTRTTLSLTEKRSAIARSELRVGWSGVLVAGVSVRWSVAECVHERVRGRAKSEESEAENECGPGAGGRRARDRGQLTHPFTLDRLCSGLNVQATELH